MLSVDEARACVLAHSRGLPAETVSLTDAVGRHLAAPLVALRTEPAYDNSAMDGYALRSADLAGAAAARPVSLTLAGESRAGGELPSQVAAGGCMRIFTGGQMPAGADAVVVQEAVSVEAGKVSIRGPVTPGDNVRREGEEYHAGELLLPEGTLLTPAAIGLAASNGLVEIAVHRRPRIAILSLGDELGQGRCDSNGPMLAAACAQAGAEVVWREQGSDDVAEAAALLRSALVVADVVVSSGSASVGDYDVVTEAWAAVGITTAFSGVAMKPGKPVRFGTVAERLVFALPGNPLAALTGYEQFVAPAIETLAGGLWRPPPRVRMPVANDVSAGRARVYFLHCDEAAGRVLVPARQGAAMLRPAATQPYCAIVPGPSRTPAGALIEAFADAGALRGGVYRAVAPLPAVISVTGPSDAGKTRMVEQLVETFVARGLRVGTVKHASHPPALDTAGKDSARHAAAGARRVVLLGPESGALYVHQGAEPELWPWLEQFAGDVDLVVVEGFKRTPLPGVRLAVGEVDDFQVEAGREDGRRIWTVTRPAVAGELHFPAELVANLADALWACVDADPPPPV